jgi:hypothetical protein
MIEDVKKYTGMTPQQNVSEMKISWLGHVKFRQSSGATDNNFTYGGTFGTLMTARSVRQIIRQTL